MEKYWFSNKETWEEERNKLPVYDDNENWSKDENGNLIAIWIGSHGWIKK